MTTRSQLDEIEDMNIAITQIIHKGKHIEDVILLLEKRGATQGHIKTIIDIIIKTYEGVRRIESSKSTRVINCIIDLLFIIVPVFAIVAIFPKSITSGQLEWLLPLIIFVYPFLYYFLPELYSGQTLGKIITGTIVVDANGSLPNIGKILVRTICRLIPFDNLSLILSDRILHDKIPNTYVVHKKRWAELYKQEK